MRQISSGGVQPPLLPERAETDYVSTATEESDLRNYWAVLVKRRKVILMVFLMVLTAGSYFTFSATPLYTTSATLKIEPQNPNVVTVAEVQPAQAGTGDYYQTQYALLKSRALAALVIKDLNLESNKAFTHARIVSADAITRIQSKLFGFLNTLIYYVQLLIPMKTEPEAPSKGSTFLDAKKEALRQGQEEPTHLEPDVPPWFVGRYLSFLKVNPVKATRLVEVQFITPDPRLSQQLANAHATGFLRMNLMSRFALTEEAREFLDKKNLELKKRLEESEAALNRYRQIHGVISLDKGENVIVDRFVQLNNSLTAARAQRIEAESLLATARSKNAQYLAQVAAGGLIPKLKGDLANLEAERTKLSTTLKPEHPRMLELSRQMSETQRLIDREMANVLRGLEENYRAAFAKEKAIQAETEKEQRRALDLKQIGVEFLVLENEAKVNRSLYESVLKRLHETNVSNDLAVSNMQVVERAEKPLGPSSPNIVMNLFLSAALGLFLGAGLVFGLEYLDSSVNTPEHVWRAVALSTFGVVPDLRSLNRPLLGWAGSTRPMLKRLKRLHLPAPSTSSELVLTDNPLSVIGESYRTIRTAFLFSQAEKPPQIVLFTSPSPGEGKTLTTLNLAIALAQDGHRVLVIDADLRKGCCHTRLELKNHNGLSNVLTGNLKLEDGIQTTRINGLFLMSAGLRPPNPSDLLGSDKMREILNNLRESFKFVLIDSPPAIAVSDAAILSVVSDGVIVVFHGKKTTRSAARQAVERLDAIRAPILGVVLNGVNLADPEYAYYRHYYGSNYGAGSEPKNGAGRVVEAAGHEELSTDEPRPEEFRPGTVPHDFLNHMTSKITDVVGHTASIIQDQMATLRESRKTFPKDRSKELFRKADESLSKHIQESIREKEKPSSYGGLSEEKISPPKRRSRNVPREFFDHMTIELCEAAGPMAPLIIRDQIDRLGESLESFPKTRLKELVERVCSEILNQKLRSNFQQTMSSEIHSL